MQELLEWVRATLPMDLDTSRMIEEKIESMLEKEKEVMCEFAEKYADYSWNISNQNRYMAPMSAEEYFNETLNTKEKWKQEK